MGKNYSASGMGVARY